MPRGGRYAKMASMKLKTISTSAGEDFVPLYGVFNSLKSEASRARETVRVEFACVRDNGNCDRFAMKLASPLSEIALRFCERVVKFLLWSGGGYEIHVAGPEALYQRLAADYSKTGARAFDVQFMFESYGHYMTVRRDDPADLPPAKFTPQTADQHLRGCRLGFDLGASDFKVSAVQDGKTVFADEFPWTPVTATSPDYLFDNLMNGLRVAAKHLPRVDAIGGSSAGVILGGQIKVASLIRGVTGPDRPKAQNLFNRIHDAWKIPTEVANDGDVTALAGAMSLGINGILGCAMGSSEAVGFIDFQGRITGRLTELAFAPVDYRNRAEGAPQDEWSKDYGVGAMYFSQQAVNYLAVKLGFAFPADMPLPERLKVVQAASAAGDERARKIYETIGTYLGWTLPWYRLFYDFGTVLILGRVTSGPGGEVIVKTALETLRQAAPALAGKVAVMMPDEKARRVGQCVAAAALPQC